MRHIICAALAVSASAPLFAQTQPTAGSLPTPEEIANKDIVTVAVGGGVVPDYEGSDDYRIIPAAAIRGKVSGISFTTRGSYLYVDVIPGNARVDFDAGPIIGARFSSRRHIDDSIVKLLPNRKTTLEAGAFAGVSFHGITNPYDSLGFRVDVLHGLGSGRGWTNVSPNIEFSTPVSRRTYVSASVGAEWAGNKYADYYFSISPSDSLRTGGVLLPFNADGGMKNWKAGVLVNQSITGDLLHGLSIFGLGQYSRLVGDFKRSPIVSQRGSASQWTGALGLAYTW
jgi:outer membrane scaffolding protein for murein synthesis (MipA/OmpV family)